MSERPEDAGWPPDETADPLLVARSYMRRNWQETTQTFLLFAIVERLDRLIADGWNPLGTSEPNNQ